MGFNWGLSIIHSGILPMGRIVLWEGRGLLLASQGGTMLLTTLLLCPTLPHLKAKSELGGGVGRWSLKKKTSQRPLKATGSGWWWSFDSSAGSQLPVLMRAVSSTDLTRANVLGLRSSHRTATAASEPQALTSQRREGWTPHTQRTHGEYTSPGFKDPSSHGVQWF